MEALVRILIAAGLSVPIGLERELRGKAAGLRTHALMAAATSALGYVSVLAATGSGTDRTRIAAQVVTGIGFLGAGVIFASGGRVHGLTTAAGVFCAAAIGLSAGLGHVVVAAALSVVATVLLGPVDWLVTRVVDRRGRSEHVVHVAANTLEDLGEAQRTIHGTGMVVSDLELSQLGDRPLARMTLRGTAGDAARLVEALGAMDGVVLFGNHVAPQVEG